MKKSHVLLLALVMLGMVALGACKKSQQETETAPPAVAVPKFAEDRPLAVEVTRVRSYYHAQNIRERLAKMGAQAYVVASNDSVAGGRWYSILVGAQKDSAELSALKTELRANFKLDSMRVVDYAAVKNAQLEITTSDIPETEMEQIDADPPDLPPEIFGVMARFPRSNMFFVEKLAVLNAPEANEDQEMYAGAKNAELDLPRGISVDRLLRLSSCFAEAVYRDNIYGDRVTLDIIQLKPEHGIPMATADSSAGSRLNLRQRAIAGYFADLVLNTGNYPTEETTEFSVPSAHPPLAGYRTVIEPKPGRLRTYLMVVDEPGEYVVFCQSTEKSESDLQEVLSLIGKSEGMSAYGEFYNTFFTLPGTWDADDVFVGFYIDKLDWSYAQSKGYRRWAKECVGHWAAHGLFYNKKKGPWTYGIFDLLTEEKVAHMMTFYSQDQGEGKTPVSVYGRQGYFVELQFFDIYSGFEWVPHEVNFPVGRYICMVDNVRPTRLSRNELIAKAERFQFQRGGYQEVADVAHSGQDRDAVAQQAAGDSVGQ